MNESATKNASVERIKNGWRLGIAKGDASSYRDAQLDDYSGLRRSRFPHRPSTTLRMSLSARTSTLSAAGTWGFGLWNDPFGLSLGFGGNPFRLPALPNAAWFFYASPQNYLSFTDDKPAQGFLAQTFRSPRFHPLLIPTGLALPFSRRSTRNLLGKVIAEDSSALSVDTTQWHRYSLEWRPQGVAWDVDEVRAFESPISPNPPLGIIIWIDNQYAAFTPEGKIAFWVLESREEWLEVKDLELKS
ncbi:hypothetical protein ANAEL_04969 [Anaerolineales bacterium]|nr:hypothetical protein ANAEL_04969 [Anaerolineales bacterium]